LLPALRVLRLVLVVRLLLVTAVQQQQQKQRQQQTPAAAAGWACARWQSCGALLASARRVRVTACIVQLSGRRACSTHSR
jgi:membrane protease subunit (stomatin/prohibitin family)